MKRPRWTCFCGIYQRGHFKKGGSVYCLIYSRVSTEDQAETGRSIGDQIKICRRFSDENGFDVAGIYKDEGKSATNMNRAGLQDLIIKCQEDKNIEAILVQDTDRLARNTTDHLQIKAMLKKVGTRVISVSQPMLDDTTPEGQFMDLVIAGVNAFQSKITGRKVSKCMLEKFRDGWWPAAAPSGYTNINTGTVEKPVNVIGVDETKQMLITKAFKTFSKGIYSADEVNSMLFKQGLSTRLGKKLSSSEFNRILKNPFYYGLMKWQGEEKMGNHKPIVTKKVFDRCQEVFVEHNHMANRERKHDFLLRGFVHCNICGSRLTAEYHGKDGKFYYHCTAKNHSNKNQNIDGDLLQQRIEQLFDQIVLPPDFVAKLNQRALEILKAKRQDTNQEKRVISAVIAKLEAKREKIEDKLFENVINNEIYQRRVEPIDTQIKGLGLQINNLDKDKKENVDGLVRLMTMSKNVGETYRTAKPRYQKHLLSIFWHRIEIADCKIKKAVPTKAFAELFPNFDYKLPTNVLTNHESIIKPNWRARWGSNPRQSPNF